MTDREDKRIATVAEFHQSAGRRFTLWSLTAITTGTTRDGRTYRGYTIYDVEWSRAYGYVFHMSGGGGGPNPIPAEGPYFATGSIAVEERPCQLVDARDKPPWRGKRTRAIRRRNRTRRLRRVPKAFALQPGQDLLDWLECHAIQEKAVWCSTCRDFFPESQNCEHVWWCERVGCFSTPGERCRHATCDCPERPADEGGPKP